ncbi:MAG: site-2 protease family protein [Senegalia sp. (in: firmicutes)]|uniref:site-2 protease family protein n=1 Tax=Senegalia sp. (in: firmicutes) TaxID=1924098 RepID=UPI003F96F585
MKLFTFKKIDINFHLLLIPIILIMYFNNYMLEFIILFVVLSFHEIGHLIVAIIEDVKIREVNIFPLGAIIKFEYPLGIEPIKEIMISIAGPLVNLILFIISYKIYINFTGIILLDFFIEVNLILFIVNILPIMPLDGGRILRGILYIHGGFKFANKFTNIVGEISLSLLFLIGLLYVKDIFEIIILATMTIYLYKAAKVENEMAAFILTRGIGRKKKKLKNKSVMKTHFLIVLKGTELKSILDIILPNRYNIIFIIDNEGNFLGNISEECFFNGIIVNGVTENIETLLINSKK